MAKRSIETTKAYILSQPLPNHGKSYTVISHKQVIDNTLKLLNDSGFTVKEELYRASMHANIAQGIYHIHPNNPSDSSINNEDELGMMFTWTNSYDKSKAFRCAIGAYVKVCSNGMLAGEMMNFKRKHTGSANMDMKVHMSDQIKNGEKYYKRLIADKDVMKMIPLDKRKISELVGRLYIDSEIIEAQQVSAIKAEINKPSFDYGVSNESAWAFYNHVTHALKKSHPKTWLQDQQDFHDFMTAEVINPGLWSNLELNTDNSDLNIKMEDVVDVVIDEDITHNRLIQDVYMGRI